MNQKKTFFSVFIALLLMCAFMCPVFAEGETGAEAEHEITAVEKALSSMEEILNPDGKIIGVCYRGLWHEYPENSLEGVEAAAKTGIDFVFVNVKMTADGVLILFSDDNASRMLGFDKNINEITYENLKNEKLLENSGGISVEKSQYNIATLEQVLLSSKENDYALMIECDVELLASVTDLLVETETISTSVIYCEDSVKNINSALQNAQELPFVMGAKKGNVVFAIYSYIKKSASSDFVGVNLKTTNAYGINYYKSVLNWFNCSMRAMASPVNPATCGKREDSVKWWDDLISRGYSVIMTNYPELFVEYQQDCDEARNRLEELYKKYTESWSLPEFSSTALNDYYKAYNDAINESESVFADMSSALVDINDAATHLQSAVDEINLYYEDLETGVAGTTITLPRILLCVAAAVVVIAVQIYFYKKREK